MNIYKIASRLAASVLTDDSDQEQFNYDSDVDFKNMLQSNDSEAIFGYAKYLATASQIRGLWNHMLKLLRQHWWYRSDFERVMYEFMHDPAIVSKLKDAGDAATILNMKKEFKDEYGYDDDEEMQYHMMEEKAYNEACDADETESPYDVDEYYGFNMQKLDFS